MKEITQIEQMDNWILFIILIAFFTVFSAVDAVTTRKLIGNPVSESLRMQMYKSALVGGLLPVVILMIYILLPVSGINYFDIGLTTVDFSAFSINRIVAIVAIICSALCLLLVLYQIIAWLKSDSYRKQISEKLMPPDSDTSICTSAEMLMIPRSRAEKKRFAVVSLSAGISEELLLRGLLFFLLRALFPGLSIYLLPVLGGAFFGLLHAYQGVIGIGKTCLVGIMFGFLYLATGSLFPCIVLHFLMDFANCFLLKEPRR